MLRGRGRVGPALSKSEFELPEDCVHGAEGKGEAISPQIPGGADSSDPLLS